tara:strand:- start:2507 stop:3154 length:648 start_codon:yes stop_codon:yes gene_type:complete
LNIKFYNIYKNSMKFKKILTLSFYTLLILFHSKVMKKLITIIILIFSTTLSNANDRDIQLNRLFDELKKNTPSVSSEVEQQIWLLWSKHPSNNKLTLMLSDGSKSVQNQKLKRAIVIFTEVIRLDPTWAEAWNKRATVYYMIGKFQKSQEDIDKVLELETRHFGALAGQGLVNIKLKNYEKAIKSYQMAKEIYPTMKSPIIMIEQIEEMIKRQSI